LGGNFIQIFLIFFQDYPPLLKFFEFLIFNCHVQWAPLNRITLGHEQFDSNNRIRLIDTIIRTLKNKLLSENVFESIFTATASLKWK
jgi:hypothetical protein